MNNINTLKIKKLEKDNDYKKIIKLYKSTFPLQERIPFFVIKKRVKKTNYVFTKYLINNLFIGFSIVYNYQKYTLIHYIVINQDLRGKGIGSQVLDLIKTEYKNNIILLDSKYFDENDQNVIKRKRVKFYQNNGFIINDFVANEYGVDYFILSNKKINKDDYYNVIGNCFNKVLIKLFFKIKK